MKTTWQQGINIPVASRLTGMIDTEVVIVGGGMTGTVLAYVLAQLGRNVVVLEKGEAAVNSTTAFTTAFLSSDIDTDFPDLVIMFGEKMAVDIWKSGQHAIDLIEEIVRTEKIDCDFMRCNEYWYTTKKDRYELDKKVQKAIDIGFDIKRENDRYVFANQGKFHPLKYLVAVRAKAEALGVVFYEHTEALAIKGDAFVTVETESGAVHARYVVQATYQPFKNPAKLFAKKGMYISYILELAIPHGIMDVGTYLDDNNPYHFIRVDETENASEDRMIIGGEDHRKEFPIHPEKNWLALEKYLEKQFPSLEYRIVRKWNGPILESIDGLPFIGRYTKNYSNRFIATAFSGNGMTYAHLAAEIIAGEINNQKSTYAYLYDPMRLALKPESLLIKTRDYMGEIFGGYFKNIFRKGISALASSKFFGLVFVFVGVLGFIPNPIIGPAGFFKADTMHNLLHVVLGSFLIMPQKERVARTVLLGVAILYFTLAAIGLLTVGGNLFGVIAVNHHDDVLHIVLGLLLSMAAVLSCVDIENNK